MRAYRRSSHRPGLLAGALTLLLGLGLLGCEIADPELPTFTTHLTVPLGTERLDIIDLVEDEDYLVALADGTLGFSVDGDPDTVSLDVDLAADIPAQTISGSLGNFTLEVASPPAFDFLLSDLYPDAVLLDGLTVPVPGFGFTTASGAEDLADLEQATLAEGRLTVTVSNGLPVPVSAASGPDRLVLELVDPASDLAVATVEFDVIAAGAEAEQEADLAGVVLPGALAVRLTGGSPGSGGSPVTVDASTSIAVAATFSDLEVSAAQAAVGPQEFITSFETDLPSDYAVEQAVIAGGTVSLTVRNDMPIACQTVVTWPHVVDLDQQPLQVSLDLEGLASATRTIDFGGRLVRAPSGQQLTALTAEVAVTSPGSGGQAVHLDAGTGVQADLGSGRIEFGSITGAVPALSYDFDPIDEDVELPDELDGLHLTRATMVLELTNTAAIAVRTDLQLVGVSAAGQERQLVIHEQIAAAEAERASVTEIVLDETNSTIVDFLNNMPTTISLAGGVELGGDGSVGTVRPDDHAVISWRIIAPVEVVIESSRLYGDPDLLDLGDGTRENIADHAGAAGVQLQVLNHLPLGIEARILFGPDTTSIKTDPLLVIGPVAIDAALVDPVSHTVSEARLCRPTVALTADEVQRLATAGLYQLFEVTLPSTEGSPVRVLTTDYVEIQGLIDLDVIVRSVDDQD